MESGLVSLINRSAVKGSGSGSSAISHVSCVEPYGRYYFDAKEYKQMMDYYCRRISTWDPQDGPIPAGLKDYQIMNSRFVSGLSEMPQEYAMLTVDIDIAVGGKEPYEVRTAEDVKKFVSAFYVAIKATFNEGPEEMAKLMTCIVAEKKPYMKRSNVVSHGIHLHFPHIFMSRSARDSYLVPVAVQEIRKDPPLVGVIEDPEECLDFQSGVSDRAWLMYGSRKSVRSEPYKVSYALNDALEPIDPIDHFVGTVIVDELGHDINLTTRKDVIFQLPRILSTSPQNRPIANLSHKSTSQIQELLRISPSNNENDDEYDIRNDSKSFDEIHLEVKQLVDMISEEYAESYQTWMQIGWAINYVTQGSDEGLGIWLEFSQLSDDKFDESRCVSEWRRCKGYTYTLGTLKYYARISSPEEYLQYINKSATNRIRDALNYTQVSGTHYDLALALFEAYGDSFVCVREEKSNRWFHFTDHHWKITPKGGDLQKLICPYLRKQFRLFRNILREEEDEHDDDDDSGGRRNDRAKADIENRRRFLSKLSTSVGSDSTQRAIMNQAAILFSRDEWIDRLGQNTKLICCKNGVIDFETCTFRDGRPEDNLCLQMPVKYRNISDTDPWMSELQLFLLKVFPNPNIRRYTIELVAGTLVGGNDRKVGPFFTGPKGNNAKSTFVKLLEGIYGPYIRKIPTTLITGSKAAAGKALPELDGVEFGVRILLGDEANAKKETINTGQYKIWTGNDSQFWRTLYSGGGTKKVLATLIFVLNHLLKFDNPHDEAAWNRTKVVEFQSVFSPDAPETWEEQMQTKTFDDDPEFGYKIQYLLEPFFYLLVQTQFRIETEKKGNPRYRYFEPKEVVEACSAYRVSSDIIGQFIRDNIEMVDKGVSTLTVKAFFSEYTHYFRTSLPGQSLPTREEIREYLLHKWADRWNGTTFLGVRMKKEDDDDFGVAYQGDGFVVVNEESEQQH